jgi:hypothetical protein
MDMDMETIRKAILKHRGGLEEATDGQIMTIWLSLDSTTQQEYLKKVQPPVRNKTSISSNGASKERKGKNAGRS